jgi:hypothetical protein
VSKTVAGHDKNAHPHGSQHAVEAFWKNLVRKNFELLRGSWSVMELLVSEQNNRKTMSLMVQNSR